jgi:iron complex outermembrane receptor protein
LPWLSLAFRQSSSRSDSFAAPGSFRPPAPGREGGPLITGDEVASSAYSGAVNRSLGVVLRERGHLLALDATQQSVGFEGFPNQRMDMTRNDNWLLAARYTGTFEWGDLEARLTYQDTRHQMDMGPDRYSYGTGMPMNTSAKTRGALVKANLILSARHLLRTGAELQAHTLYDWWPPVGGSMGPNTFWNIDYGRRRRIDTYGEWEARWDERWTTQLGMRSDTVTTDASPVQGYDNGLGVWGEDAAAFNAKERRRTDWNWDLSTSTRFTPSATQTYEAGYARKSRSPSLYQRYPWATNAMAALMNNVVGDGNGYVGNVALRPETANTVSVTGDWHDAARGRWAVKATGHYTHVHDYIDARRCDFGQCSAENVTATNGFVLLQYTNVAARLYGLDLSSKLLLADAGRYGKLTGTSTVGWVRGDNLTTGDALYNVMPLNALLALVHQLRTWSATAEVQAVAAKDRVSRVRNELETGAYYLCNLRSSYEWRSTRLDVAVENVFDRLYFNPLGGAYVGQGPSMSTAGVPWGVPVAGMGRSVHLAAQLRF